jgi:hypothetical protein
MKARIALANFKLEHGYSNIDLRTLESYLYKDKVYKKKQPLQLKLRRKQSHQFYPKHFDMDRLIKKNAPNRASPTIPLSNTRLPAKRLSLSSDVEAAAHLLVLLHHSPTL